MHNNRANKANRCIGLENARFHRLLCRSLIGLIAAMLLFALVGCGGGAIRLYGPTGANPTPILAPGGRALTRFDVNVALGRVTISRINATKGRAILTGGAVSFTSSDLLWVGGDSGQRVLNLTAINNTGEKISGQMHLVVGNLSNSPAIDLRSEVEVATVAGSGAAGSADGYGTAASFNNPHCIVPGRGPLQGAFVICEDANNTIRLLQGGMVTTFAGKAVADSFADGTGAAARFADPEQVTVDDSGNIYVSDRVNNRIRRISPFGEVSTIAGTGVSGENNGPGDTATLNDPVGVAVSPDGNRVYVAEPYGIRLLTYTTGARNSAHSYTASTLTGSTVPGFTDGAGDLARFGFLHQMTLVIDPKGTDRLYATDTGNGAIRRIDLPAAGPAQVTTIAGNGVAGTLDGPGTTAEFDAPAGITAIQRPDGTDMLFVTDYLSGLLRAITSVAGKTALEKADYQVTTLAGNGNGYADGDGYSARFNGPDGMAAIAAPGPSATLYMAEYVNNRIRKVTVGSGALQSGDTGSAVTEPVRLINGDSEAPNQTAWIKNMNGASTQLQFYVPAGVSGFSFTVYVEADTESANLPAVGASFVTTLAGDGYAGFENGPGRLAEFYQPISVAIPPGGAHTTPFGTIRAFVADSQNHTIRALDPSGNVTTLAGGRAGFADGPASVARFQNPRGIAAGPDGALYIADTGNARIRRISLVHGVVLVSTIAGTGVFGARDGTGNNAQFVSPAGITVDSGGTLSIADTGAHVLRQIQFAGGDPNAAASYNVVTIAGAPGTAGSTDGPGASARFNAPAGLYADTEGQLYVADTGNHTVRMLTRTGFNSYSVSTLAGSAGYSGTTDGTGASARFNAPIGLCGDTAHNLYVADSGNNRIRRIGPGGVVVTLAGSSAGMTDGIAGAFRSPSGVTLEPSGDLLVCDALNHSIRTVQRLLSEGQPGGGQ
ncbi:MAG TPA: hypothetical protein VKU00_29295 [Chthonomonadaceae bacterium]|nr:hypothetical protein [Chthonomonadaceae bacterium]